jgi:hypothetical protein
MTSENKLLTQAEAGEYLSLSPRLLQQWRYLGQGPPYARLGRHIRYRRADLDAWVAVNAVEPAGAAAGDAT